MYVCAHMRYVQYASVCFRGRGIAGIPWMDSNEILRFSLSWARFSPVPPHHHPQHAATYSISEPRTSSTYMRNVIPDPEAASTLEHVWDSCILGSPILILYPPGGRPGPVWRDSEEYVAAAAASQSVLNCGFLKCV